MNPLISTGNYADTAKKICVDYGIFSEDSQLLSEYIDGGNINYTFRVTDTADQKSVIVKIAEEKAKIGRLEGDCARYMAKGAKDGFFDKLQNIGSEIMGILEGILGK